MRLIKKSFLIGFVLKLFCFLNLLYLLIIVQVLKKLENKSDLEEKTVKSKHQTRSPLIVNESYVINIIQNMGFPLNFNFNGFNNVTGADKFIVPNIVHYIRFQQIRFTFIEYICLISVYTYHRPSLILIHTDVNKYGGFKGIFALFENSLISIYITVV